LRDNSWTSAVVTRDVLAGKTKKIQKNNGFLAERLTNPDLIVFSK